MKYSYAVLSQFFVLLIVCLCMGAENEVLIQPPLSWSIDSIRVVWSVSEGTTANETTKLIYSAEHSASEGESSSRINTDDRVTSTTGATGGRVESSAALNSNPFTLFGLLGAKVSASGFMESSNSYQSRQSCRSMDEWSDSEKETVAAAFSASSEQSTTRTASNRKLVFSVNFVNHTSSRLMFDPTSANSVPVYCGGVHLGDAKLADPRATIAATGKPIPCRFEMPLDDSGKMAILKKRPKMSIESGQLLIRTSGEAREQVADAIQESIVSGSYYTIALTSQDLVEQWHIRWFRATPVTLKEALEAINEQIRADNNNDERTLFCIEGDCLTQVCAVSLQPGKDDKWIVQAEYVKKDHARAIEDFSEELKSAPGRGSVYVFSLLNKRIADLISKANSGSAQAQYDLAVCYDNGDGVDKNAVEAMEWRQKAAKGGNVLAQEYLEKLNNPFYTKDKKAGDRVVTTLNGVEFAFRWCPPGSFTMGSPESEEDRDGNETQHKVTISEGFWLMETEVTQAQWKAVMGTTIEQQRKKAYQWWKNDAEDVFRGVLDLETIKAIAELCKNLYGEGSQYPMYYVSWDDCQDFCKKAQSLGLPLALPSEARWEYACRAGTTGPYAGNLDAMAWYSSNSGGKTHSVGAKKPNAWGLYDMHGNVWEWCADVYNCDISSIKTDIAVSGDGSFRVLRGGCWSSDAGDCRSASRDRFSPDYRDYFLGLRCCLVQ